jgi:hypothetical protein
VEPAIGKGVDPAIGAPNPDMVDSSMPETLTAECILNSFNY